MEILYPVNNFIVQNFKKFYYEVLREKARALRITHEQDEGEAEESVTTLCQSIQHHLHELLESQSLDAVKQVGEFASAHYREAQYVMVALADEVFLRFDWVGRVWWENHLLETKIFHTQIAGELFFERLDDLIRGQDPVKIDLAVVYLLSLGLGFRGQYVDSHEDLHEYRQQLFAMIVHHSSDLFHGGRDYLIDDPYMHNIEAEHSRKLPEVRLWMWSFATIAVIYLFVSYVFWYGAVKDVESAINAIQLASESTV